MSHSTALNTLLGPPRRVLPDDWQTMPWRNGGGRTHELLKLGEGAQGFALRISVAEVTADGPFSRFEGVDRSILLLSGAGMTLTWPRGDRTHLTRATPRLSFPGEVAPQSVLIDGPTTDLNVMVDRATLQAEVSLAVPGEITAPLIFLLRAGQVNGEALPAHTLLVRPGRVACDAPMVAISLNLHDG
ncbi:MAG: HutD family protein [Deltaproteobacteria bacterium]|nr:HutD family protein [Deltaproteobacteria bacterium]